MQILLGAALLLGAFAMVLRYGLDRRSGRSRHGLIGQVVVRPLPTVAIGVLGGFVVGMTSVGSGSLMIVPLLFLYPVLGANQLVGTDLTQAVPLTLAAVLGAPAFGHVVFAVTTSIVLGSVPAVLVGSLISSWAPDRYIRPVITFVIFVSGLKYVGLSTTAWADARRRSGRRRRHLARLRPPAAGRARTLSAAGAPGPDVSARGGPSAPPPRRRPLSAGRVLRGCGSRASAARP